jgi:hypothetical protein
MGVGWCIIVISTIIHGKPITKVLFGFMDFELGCCNMIFIMLNYLFLE